MLPQTSQIPRAKLAVNTSQITQIPAEFAMFAGLLLSLMILYVPSLVVVQKQLPQIPHIPPDFAKFAEYLPQIPRD